MSSGFAQLEVCSFLLTRPPRTRPLRPLSPRFSKPNWLESSTSSRKLWCWKRLILLRPAISSRMARPALMIFLLAKMCSKTRSTSLKAESWMMWTWSFAASWTRDGR